VRAARADRVPASKAVARAREALKAAGRDRPGVISTGAVLARHPAISKDAAPIHRRMKIATSFRAFWARADVTLPPSWQHIIPRE